MQTKIVPMAEVSAWMSDLLKAGGDGHAFMLICLFGGDRAHCCDEAAIITIDDAIAAVASIAPQGEMQTGQPAIVGLYTVREHRRKGLGKTVLEAAINRIQERGLPLPIQLDVVSKEAMQLIAKLSAATKGILEVNDQSF